MRFSKNPILIFVKSFISWTWIHAWPSTLHIRKIIISWSVILGEKRRFSISPTAENAISFMKISTVYYYKYYSNFMKNSVLSTGGEMEKRRLSPNVADHGILILPPGVQRTWINKIFLSIKLISTNLVHTSRVGALIWKYWI